jgi:hypothetical protein
LLGQPMELNHEKYMPRKSTLKQDAEKGHQRRSQSLSLLTYKSTFRGLRSLGPCWMTFLSILFCSRESNGTRSIEFS